MKFSSPAVAALAATLLARLPVLAQPDGSHTELAGLGQGDRHHAILERQVGKLTASFLSPVPPTPSGLGQAIGANQRRAANLRADSGFAVERQEFAVSPHGPRPCRSSPGSDGLGDPVVVVGNFERPEVVDAEVERSWDRVCRKRDTSARSRVRSDTQDSPSTGSGMIGAASPDRPAGRIRG